MRQVGIDFALVENGMELTGADENQRNISNPEHREFGHASL
jgi:hypothetical protein